MNNDHFSPSACHNLMYETSGRELEWQADSYPSVEHWQSHLRDKVAGLTGLTRITPSKDLAVESIWKQDDELGTIERIVFRSEPHTEVPAYVCLPAGVEKPYTFFICVQGHSTGMHNSIGRSFDDEFALAMPEGDRDFALGCMRRGIAALCIEQRAFGYRQEQLQQNRAGSYCHDAAMHSLMLGRTLVGERVFDVRRGVDYLSLRGDAAMDRIGLMGNSGGGTTTMFASALLPEISFAIPSCYFNTFQASIMSLYHCSCNYVPSILRYAEMSDVMGLFAPRKLVVVAGRDDDIFPLEATQASFDRLKGIYRAAGAEDNCRLVIGEGGHRFYADDAWPVMLSYLNSDQS